MRGVKIKAVTLVELLVVIAIITVLAGLLMAVFSRAMAKGEQVACLSNLHQLDMADLMYAQDYHGYFPPFENIDPGSDCDNTNDGSYFPSRCAPMSLHNTLMPYVEDDRVWFCPNDPVAGKDINFGSVDHKLSSYWFVGSFVSYRLNTSTGGSVAIHTGEKNPVLIFPPTQAWLITDSGTDADPSEGNIHFGGINVAFVDGHAKWMSSKQ